MNEPKWLADYRALTEDVGFAPLERTQIELAGKDRASFLHNLCTNEIKKLPIGDGCEAFITSVQGKTVGHGLVFSGPDSLVFDTEPGQGEALLKHLDHYLVCEQVVLSDRSEEWAEVLVVGPKAGELVTQTFGVTAPEKRLSSVVTDWDGTPVWVRRVDVTAAPGYFLNVSRERVAALCELLAAAGVRKLSDEAVEAARIEHGFPQFGQDVSDKNLPQELSRDNQAISFVKGCYLGQETVARIDALGHVNKSLVGLKFNGGSVPAVGEELKSGELVVGQVTSATFSPRLAAPLALGYVKQGHSKPGTRLSAVAGEVEVVGLPVG